jgi:hypothetical protein
MATLVIKDLVLNEELDRNAMTNVRGGMLNLTPESFRVVSPDSRVEGDPYAFKVELDGLQRAGF